LQKLLYARLWIASGKALAMTKTIVSLRGMSKANDEAIYNNEKKKNITMES